MSAMKHYKTLAIVFAVTLCFPAFAAQTAQQTQKYEPSVGQAGKDVVWVPTPEGLVAAMLDMAKVTPSDYLIDLGSGDGRIVIAAAKRGTRALGVEFNPDMVQLSQENAQKEGVSDKASIVHADIFETDFSRATVLTMYLMPHLNMRLRPKILEMKPGTRVVAHAFTMEDWEADQTVSVEERTAYLWIVPAKVEGTWTWNSAPGKAELALRQTFQKIEGTLRLDGKELPLQNAKLEGDRISFAAGVSPADRREYSGRVNGNVIAGTFKSAGNAGGKWSAERRGN
jgi:precorrin-6B methylase 2